jgi:hypothetical protein
MVLLATLRFVSASLFLPHLIVMMLRLLLPIYQPLRWLNSLRYSLWLFRDISVTCIVLKKTHAQK